MERVISAVFMQVQKPEVGGRKRGRREVVSSRFRPVSSEPAEREMCVNAPMVAYACAIPPPIPPRSPPRAGEMFMSLVTFSISAAVKRRTAPLVEASIHAQGIKPW